MTEKVKIPQEVADAINYLKSERYPMRQIIKNALNENWCNEPEENDVDIEILNGMDAEKLVLAVHGYCEIEGYKVGEWVVYDEIDPKPAVKIIAIQYERGRVQFEGMSNWRVIREIERHATPEEIKVEQERQKWAEIEPGDVVELIHSESRIGIFVRCDNDKEVLVRLAEMLMRWQRDDVELYAKKVGASK